MVSNKPDIIKIIRAEGVELTRTGDCYKGLCPWHDDSDPSFVVWPDSQIFKCFGECNVTGDVITFIKHHKHFTFKQACNYLKVIPGKTRQERLDNDFLNTLEHLIITTRQATGQMPTGEHFAEYSIVMLPQILEWIASEIMARRGRQLYQGKSSTKTGAQKNDHQYTEVEFS